LVVGLLLPPRLAAAEGILSSGKAVRGNLTWAKSRLVFVASAGKKSYGLEELDQVRFPFAAIPPLRCATVHRLTLPGGQRLTGELLGLDGQTCRFRPAWGPAVSIPRPAVAALTQLPGFQTFLDDDFEAGAAAWKLTGKPALSGKQRHSGKQSLLLTTAGQAAEYSLPRPLAAGRAGVNFYDPLLTQGNRWLVEADFSNGKAPWAVRVFVAGDGDNYTAEIPGADGKGFAAPRSAGWHRLQVDFSARRLLITVDDAVLWASRLRGAPGPLRKVRLVCEAAAVKAKPQGEVFFDDFGLARSALPLRHRRADPGQDELWLLSGDQILGSVTKADRRTLELRARFGSRSWSWGEVRGLFPRQQPSQVRTTEGEQVQVWLRTGAGSEPDRVTGEVRDLDEKRLTLRHALLGDLAIDRARVRRIRWFFSGRRIELDFTEHHLGPKGKLADGLHPPRAEGPSLRWSFRLSAVPESARLRLNVVRLKGPGDGIGPALRRGELRTEVVLNGRVVDYLNRHVQHSSRVSLPLTIAIPKRALRAGNNTLVLRQTPERETQHMDSCGVSDLVIEIPR
jgi:hypothetical protein